MPNLRVSLVQPVPTGFSPYGYVLSVLIGFDVLVSALTGGPPYMTISARIGESVASGGFFSRVWLPAWFKRHCAAAIYTTTV